MKHIKIYEEENLLDDLDGLVGRGQVTSRCYGWYVTWYSGEQHDPAFVGVAVMATSEMEAIDLIFENHMGLDPEEWGEFLEANKSARDFHSVSYAFQNAYQDYDDGVPLYLHAVEMTPRNRGVKAVGIHDIAVGNPYKCVEELDRFFTDAKAKLAKEG